MKFDKEQKKYGMNKHGHFQFGNESCRVCKSDDTHELQEWWDRITGRLNRVPIMECKVCSARWPV